MPAAKHYTVQDNGLGQPWEGAGLHQSAVRARLNRMPDTKAGAHPLAGRQPPGFSMNGRGLAGNFPAGPGTKNFKHGCPREAIS